MLDPVLVEFLGEDELAVECDVRQIDPSKPAAVTELCKHIEIELLVPSTTPLRPHRFLNPRAEFKECDDKLLNLSRALPEAIRAHDTIQLFAVIASAGHLVDRLDRFGRVNDPKNGLPVESLRSAAMHTLETARRTQIEWGSNGRQSPAPTPVSAIGNPVPYDAQSEGSIIMEPLVSPLGPGRTSVTAGPVVGNVSRPIVSSGEIRAENEPSMEGISKPVQQFSIETNDVHDRKAVYDEPKQPIAGVIQSSIENRHPMPQSGNHYSAHPATFANTPTPWESWPNTWTPTIPRTEAAPRRIVSNFAEHVHGTSSYPTDYYTPNHQLTSQRPPVCLTWSNVYPASAGICATSQQTNPTQQVAMVADPNKTYIVSRPSVQNMPIEQPPLVPDVATNAGMGKSQPFNTYNNNARKLNPMTKWRIRFDGSRATMSVEEFLFRLDALASADQVPETQLSMSLHLVLTGKAENWFWLYRRRFPNYEWKQLKDALQREFRSESADHEIRRLIDARRQQPKEAFSDFRMDIDALVARMVVPIVESELVCIVRRNMNPKLQEYLMLREVSSMDELRDLCRKYERHWALNRKADVRPTTRNVSEVDYANNNHMQNEPITHENDDESQHIDAFERSRYRQASEPNPGNTNRQSPFVCWRCERPGHSFRNCREMQTRLFCERCGTANVAEANCQCRTLKAQTGGSEPGRIRPENMSSPNHH